MNLNLVIPLTIISILKIDNRKRKVLFVVSIFILVFSNWKQKTLTGLKFSYG